MSLRAHVTTTRGSFAVEAAIEAADGETVALVGPNGAGKSTVVEVLAGTLGGGEITIDDRSLGDAAPQDRNAGVLFQDRRLFPRMTARDNVAFPLRAAGLSRADARARADGFLARAGIAHKADARADELSGGEAQRVALARALAREPRILLLDEPFSSHDVVARAEMRALLHETLRRFDGVAIFVSHDPSDVLTLADRIVLMEEGRVTQQGPHEAFQTAPRTAYAAELVGVNVVRGTVDRMEEHVAIVRSEHGELHVATAFEPGTPVVATIKPADVAVFREEPHGSARNVIGGVVRAITIGAGRARLQIDGAPPIVAEVTLGSLQRLQLREGDAVWSVFKATEVLARPL